MALRNGGFGDASDLPQGTNALNASLTFWFLQHHSPGLWLYPLTDWGQPYPGFTGPTLLTPFIDGLPPTVLVRGIEFAGYVGAGLSMMHSVRRLGGTFSGGFAAGMYYSVLVQTPQFFEGHVPAMISLALGPLLFVGLWQTLWRPTFRLALLTTLVLYLLVSIGDLGILYFYVFFAVPLAGYVVLRRNVQRLYRWKELAAIAAGLTLFVVLCLSWLYPYAAGVRPEYTTNVTTNIIPFSNTFSENLGYAITGYVQDNSLIHIIYQQKFYSLGGLTLLPLFFLVPLAVTIYGVLGRRLDRIVLLASAGLAIVFSTGDLYPVLAPFNRWVYDHVPFFDSIPALYRWAVYSILAFSLLLGLLISALERDAEAGFVELRALAARGRRLLRLGGRTAPPAPGAPAPRAGRRNRRVVAVACVLGVVTLVMVQNFALVSEPVGLFSYPAEYQAGASYIGDRPVTGSVLVEPFSGIYERTPWAEVGASSGLMLPYYTGADGIIFEAGTPYSLALDNFLGGGIVDGASRNMTAFLALANVQYILANRYSPWGEISAFPYRGDLAYNALSNQSGLGTGLNLSATQTLYTVANSSGNVSFDPHYLVYLGGDDLLYAVLDAPWYGARAPLVNGSSVGDQLVPLVDHSEGLVVTPAALAALNSTVLSDAHAAGVPILVVEPAEAFTLHDAVLQSDPWNVSGGVDVRATTGAASAAAAYDLAHLVGAAYGPVAVTAELAAPPGAAVAYSLNNVTGVHWTSNSSIVAQGPLDYAAPGFARTNATNSTEGFHGNVTTVTANGTVYLDWKPLAQDTAPQSLELNVSNLTAWQGLQVTIKGNVQIPLVWNITYGQTTAFVPGYPTIVPTPPNNTVYRFVLPPGDNGMPQDLLTHLGNLTEFCLQANSTGVAPELQLSNLTLLRVDPGPLASVPLGTAPGGDLNVSVSLPAGARLGRLTITTGALPQMVPDPGVHDFAAQSPDGPIDFPGPALGWGVVTFAQTYSPIWSASGPGPAVHAVVDVGLNGWFVEGGSPGTWVISYTGTSLLHTAVVGEGIGLAALGGVAVLAVSIQRRRSRRAVP